jgi:hypothetical protein
MVPPAEDIRFMSSDPHARVRSSATAGALRPNILLSYPERVSLKDLRAALGTLWKFFGTVRAFGGSKDHQQQA